MAYFSCMSLNIVPNLKFNSVCQHPYPKFMKSKSLTNALIFTSINKFYLRWIFNFWKQNNFLFKAISYSYFDPNPTPLFKNFHLMGIQVRMCPLFTLLWMRPQKPRSFVTAVFQPCRIVDFEPQGHLGGGNNF